MDTVYFGNIFDYSENCYYIALYYHTKCCQGLKQRQKTPMLFIYYCQIQPLNGQFTQKCIYNDMQNTIVCKLNKYIFTHH